MAKKAQSQSGQAIVAVLLSLILPGAGQLYLRRIFKGLVLVLSFALAIIILWFGLSSGEFKMLDWGGKSVMFSPSMKSIMLGGHVYKMTAVMKVTGTLQLVITWIFGLVDAWRDAISVNKHEN
jgi:hypothetical protein